MSTLPFPVSLCCRPLILLVCLVPLGCGFGNGNDADAALKKSRKDPVVVIPVEAAVPNRGSISDYLVTVARVEAEKKVNVVSEGIGEVLELYVEEGDTVTQGQVLAELDKKDAEAMYRQTQVQVKQTETTYVRAKDSYAQGLGPRVEMENAEFSHEQAMANLESQRVQLENKTIRAPISGVVTARAIQKGMVVASNPPAFTIVDPLTYMLAIEVPERDLAKVIVGQVAKVTIDAIADQEFEARVRRINPGVDPVKGVVKVVLDFDEAVRTKLRDSAFARVRLVMETHESALMIGRDAIIEENARQYVFVLRPNTAPIEKPADAKDEAGEDTKKGNEAPAPKDGDEDEAEERPEFVAERLEIQVGLEDAGMSEILSGIADADRVITNGQHTLKPGAFVRVTTPAESLGANAGRSAAEMLATVEAREKKDAPEKEGPGGADDSK